MLAYTVTSNNINIISIPFIALNESNDHRGCSFMSLYTGNKIHSYEWTELPIDNYVIKQVNQLSSDEKFPLVKDKYPMF